MTTPVQDAPCREQFERGVRTFGRLFTRWMDLNEWSHPKMASLAKGALGGVGWLHSSQISGLRHCKLESPGPRTFIAIERLNYYLHRYVTTKTLIPGSTSSNHYAKAFVITENGEPPPLGWWIEVFCGYRVPSDIDLQIEEFSQVQAPGPGQHPPGSAARRDLQPRLLGCRGTRQRAPRPGGFHRCHGRSFGRGCID